MNDCHCPTEDTLHFVLEVMGKPPKNFKEENYVIQFYILEMSLWPPQVDGGLSEIEGRQNLGQGIQVGGLQSRHHTLERPQGSRGQEPCQRAPPVGVALQK